MDWPLRWPMLMPRGPLCVQVDDALMEKAPKLRVVGRAGVGVDNIDAEAATRVALW